MGELHEAPGTTKRLPSRTNERNGLICLIAGMWLLHEASVYGVLLDNGGAWILFPISFVLIWLSELLGFPYIFWGALFVVFPFGGLALFVIGAVTLFQQLFSGSKASTQTKTDEPTANIGT